MTSHHLTLSRPIDIFFFNFLVDIAMMTLVEKVLEVAKSNAMPQPENNVVQLNSRPEPKEQACCLNGF